MNSRVYSTVTVHAQPAMPHWGSWYILACLRRAKLAYEAVLYPDPSSQGSLLGITTGVRKSRTDFAKGKANLTPHSRLPTLRGPSVLTPETVVQNTHVYAG